MNVKELGFDSIVATVGTIITVWFGGWDVALRVLIAFMVIDYVTGFLGAIKTKSVDSEIMFWGGIRKGIIYSAVVIATLLLNLFKADIMTGFFVLLGFGGLIGITEYKESKIELKDGRRVKE